jgi:hypothetical protein
MMDALGQAGSDYRWKYYLQGISGECAQTPVTKMIEFLNLVLQYVDHSLTANKRSDNLYHAYNILQLNDDGASVGHLYEMLEGQVAILSSGLLSDVEALELLESLRHSQLYRPDQHSYLLYPDRNPPGFLEKNLIIPEQVRGIGLVKELEKVKDKTLIVRDEEGNYHFNGDIRNAKDVTRALEALKDQPRFTELVKADTEKIQILFEYIFHHSEFTGRSGTFFAYEGLGSIYWHMVSKLLLAVQETIFSHCNSRATERMIERYVDIRQGLSFNKPPDVYGAFPTDPYSHTPKNQGAKQPGMTGLVKEEILTRQAELGWLIENGKLKFNFILFDKREFLSKHAQFHYWNIEGQEQKIGLQAGSMAYSICQVPVVLQISDEESIGVYYSDGSIQLVEGHVLDPANSAHIFQRDGSVQHLVVLVRSFDGP